jgi:hypothetical protein
MSFLDRRITPDSLLTVMRCPPQHMHAEMLLALFNIANFHFVFMTVRHPVARLVSEYRMRATDNPDIAKFDAWLDASLAARARDPFALDNHLRPQAEFWLPGCTVFRLEETFDAAFIARLIAGIGCTFEDRRVPTEMHNRLGPATVPSDASRKRIAEVYRRDFELFGYDSAQT